MAMAMRMPAMHEEVKQRARKNKQIGQIWDHACDMRAMLRPQKVTGYRQKSDERNPEPPGPLRGFAVMIVGRHGLLVRRRRRGARAVRFRS